jgi:hypothetical protein
MVGALFSSRGFPNGLSMIALVQLAAETPVKDIVSYIVEAVLLFACGFVWRTNAIIVELRTLLKDPDQGLLAHMRRLTERLDGTEEDTSRHSSRLDVHGTRLDGHDEAIEEIKDDRRHFKRRASDRAGDAE